MKFCFECGAKLDGCEKTCPSCGTDLNEIKINPRSTDKAYFESAFLQTLSDQIDIFTEDMKVILEDFESSDLKKQIDDFDIVEFGENTLDQVSDIKDEVLKDNLPEVFEEFSKNTKIALNRDADYVNHAKRKLKRDDFEKTNLRIIELCNKAISLNELNDEAYYIKGIALLNLEKYDESIDEFITSLALNDENLDAKIRIADANRLKGDLEDAISVYESVLDSDKNSFDSLKGIALSYFKLKDYQNADYFFKKANDAGKLDDDSLNMWGIIKKEIKEE